MDIITKIKDRLLELYYHSSSKRYISYLRKKGVILGKNCVFRVPRKTRIDMTRPWLITIGNNVDFNVNFQLLTHDWTSSVFRNTYNDFVNSSGCVHIGNNVYFGANVIILKGVRIGNNCIIGAGSIITNDIPDNSVAVGCPCKVISSLYEYYTKRKEKALREAIENVRCYRERFGRNPSISDMNEEFIYFVDKENIKQYSGILPIEEQLGGSKNLMLWLNNHEALFKSYDEFIGFVQ